MIGNAERDKIHSERVRKLVSSITDGNIDDLQNLFVSNQVHNSIDQSKAFHLSYNYNNVLAELPFHKNIFVLVCPACVTVENLSQFSTLVERSAIIPVMMAPYRAYDEAVTQIVYPRDHVSSYEYRAFRTLHVSAQSDGGVCHHCVKNWERGANRIISKRPSISGLGPERFLSNIHPFVSPDSDLLDTYKSALRKEDADTIFAIQEMSEVIYAIRTAQAFQAPIHLTDQTILSLPAGLTTDIDDARNTSERLRRDISDGLGLRIPTDIPLEEYLEIVTDYRPRIAAAVDKIYRGNKKSKKSATSIQTEIMKINGDIERLKTKNRYMLLEASLDFYDHNKSLINAALMAGVFGLAGNVAGCVGGAGASAAVGAATSGAASLALKKKWVTGGKITDRFIQKIESDLLPIFTRIVSTYTSTSFSAVNVLALRTRVQKASQLARASAVIEVPKKASRQIKKIPSKASQG